MNDLNINKIFGNSQDEILLGLGGNDELFGLEGDDKLYGGKGNDKLYGDSGNDKLYGDSGKDKLYGGSGKDYLKGGSSYDRLYGGSGKDYLYGGTGNDYLKGGSSSDRLYGESGKDKLHGGKGNDYLKGGSGKDKLYGGSGKDKLYGGSSSDRLYGGSGKDKLYGGSGKDYLKGGSSSDRLYGGSGKDYLYGGTGKDYLKGGSSSDRLYGESGKDKLHGGKGNDKLWGGSSNDKLYGGPGNDKLYGGSGDDYLSGQDGSNLLTGGEGSDTFILNADKGYSNISDFSISEDSILIKHFNFGDLSLTQLENDVGINIDDNLVGLIQNTSAENLIYLDGFIRAADDYSSDINTVGRLGINSTVFGNLETNGDRDWFSINLEEGETYQLDMKSFSESGTLPDSFLYLRDSKGDLITSDDDNGNGLDSQIFYTATYSGDHYLDAGSYRDNYSGTYTLSSSFIEIEEGWSISNGWGQVNAAQAFENLLGFELEDRDDLGGNMWGLDAIDAQDVWLGSGDFQGVTGVGTTIAVVDTGIDYEHDEFEGRIVQGWDFVDNDSIAEDGNGHGTHVAGTIAGANDGVGITGVAYDANIMPIRVLDSNGRGTYSAVNAGIRFAADNGADVINLSLGGGGYNQSVYDAIRYASERGSVVVMASGNSGLSAPGYPARYAIDYGIAVGAFSMTRDRAYFSNRSGITSMDYVSAPGMNVYSAIPGNNYSYFSGTSMATPHVAGIAALLSSYDNQISANEIEQLIISSGGNFVNNENNTFTTNQENTLPYYSSNIANTTDPSARFDYNINSPFEPKTI